MTRYFDHIQSSPSVRLSAKSLEPAFSLVSFDLDNAPKSERKVEPPKKKEKKGDAPVAANDSGKGKAAAAPTESKSDGKQPKEKKDKKKDAGAADGKKGGGKAAPVAEDAGEPVPSMVDLRVGHIVDSKFVRILLASEVNIRILCSQKTSGRRWSLYRGKT